MSQLDRVHYKDNWLDRIEALERRVAELERKPAVSMARVETNAGQSIGNNAIEKVEFDTVVIDPLGEYDTTNYRFTSSRGGHYFVSTFIFFNATTAFAGAAEFVRLELYKNGARACVLEREDDFSGTACYPCIGGADVVYLGPGEYAEIWVIQVSGAARTLYSGEDHFNYVTYHRIG